MHRRHTRSTRHDTLLPETTLFRSHLHQLRFGVHSRPKAKKAKATVSTAAAARQADPLAATMPLVAAFRDLLIGKRRQTSEFTVAPLWGSSPARPTDRKSTRLNSSHYCATRMPSSA